MDGWNTIVSFWVPGLFSGALAVSFREGFSVFFPLADGIPFGLFTTFSVGGFVRLLGLDRLQYDVPWENMFKKRRPRRSPGLKRWERYPLFFKMTVSKSLIV